MSPARQAMVGLALSVLAAIFLGYGLVAPSVEFSTFYFLTDRHSILSVIEGLWLEGETLLAAVLGLFSVVFPVLKLISLILAALAMATTAKMPKRSLRLSVMLGRWSMLDVLVLALVIFYVKNTAAGDATTLPGIWFFAASVVLTMLAAIVLSDRSALTK